MTNTKGTPSFSIFMEKPGPKIMGILNATPDSFAGDGILSHVNPLDAVFRKMETFIKADVDIVDIGGESTRPSKALPISEEEELSRVIPVIEALRQRFEVPLSIDTFKAGVAREALKRGVFMVNDVSGLIADPLMGPLVAEFKAPIVVTHSYFSKEFNQMDHTASKSTGYDKSIVTTVMQDLKDLVQGAIDQGVSPFDIIVDPGIGFGKSTLENVALLKNLAVFKELGYPILVGASRKTFIGQLTGQPADQRLPGSLGAATIALLKGADFIRVHDALETRQIVQLVRAMERVE